jgi:hypothetical protein
MTGRVVRRKGVDALGCAGAAQLTCSRCAFHWLYQLDGGEGGPRHGVDCQKRRFAPTVAVQSQKAGQPSLLKLDMVIAMPMVSCCMLGGACSTARCNFWPLAITPAGRCHIGYGTCNGEVILNRVTSVMSSS